MNPDMMAALAGSRPLRKTETKDRSAPNTSNATPDALKDEEERWKYFFDSGCSNWFDMIKDQTFSSTFCDLTPQEAHTIVDHWLARERLLSQAAQHGEEALEAELAAARAALVPLATRLEVAVAVECAKSSAGRAFVKLSTRSPKDSKKILSAAGEAYRARLDAAAGGGEEAVVDDNARWVMLSEEVTKASSVRSAAEAIDFLLDSARVYELRCASTHLALQLVHF